MATPRFKTFCAKLSELYDCIVIGAGPAGLTAALFLARYRHRSLTFHHNSPRNEYAGGVHGFLGHHGILPNELLARGRDEVTAHGGLILESRVERVSESPKITSVLLPATVVCMKRDVSCSQPDCGISPRIEQWPRFTFTTRSSPSESRDISLRKLTHKLRERPQQSLNCFAIRFALRPKTRHAKGMPVAIFVCVMFRIGRL